MAVSKRRHAAAVVVDCHDDLQLVLVRYHLEHQHLPPSRHRPEAQPCTNDWRIHVSSTVQVRKVTAAPLMPCVDAGGGGLSEGC
ncbi:Hypothetical predicted protein, partial [Olea europaea subsp. europaea]